MGGGGMVILIRGGDNMNPLPVYYKNQRVFVAAIDDKMPNIPK